MAIVDALVGQLAREQQGVLLREQLLALGMSDRAIARRVEQARLNRIARGLFVLASAPHGFLRSAVAAALAHDAVVARQWAATWWGLEGFPAHAATGPVALLTTMGRSGRSPMALATIERSRRMPADDVVPLTEHDRAAVLLAAREQRRVSRGGARNVRTALIRDAGEPLHPAVRPLVRIPSVTKPARTIVDLIRTWERRPLELDRLVDDAVARGLVTVEQLAAVADRCLPARSAGRAGVTGHLTKRGGGFLAPDSELERIGRAAFKAWRCPTPVMGTAIPGRPRHQGQVDFAFPDQRVIIELDGRRWHLSEGGFQSDRSRDRAALLAGWRPFRYTWDDFTVRRAVTRDEIRRLFGG